MTNYLKNLKEIENESADYIIIVCSKKMINFLFQIEEVHQNDQYEMICNKFEKLLSQFCDRIQNILSIIPSKIEIEPEMIEKFNITLNQVKSLQNDIDSNRNKIQEDEEKLVSLEVLNNDLMKNLIFNKKSVK